jgi:hypothetical protein
MGPHLSAFTVLTPTQANSFLGIFLRSLGPRGKRQPFAIKQIQTLSARNRGGGPFLREASYRNDSRFHVIEEVHFSGTCQDEAKLAISTRDLNSTLAFKCTDRI